MDTLFGLPAHPFLVHIPIVLLPLAALGAVIMVIRPSWHQRYRWSVLAIGVVGSMGTVLAAAAGEELAKRIVAIEGVAAAAGWEEHAHNGETARLFAIVFLAVLIVLVFAPMVVERRGAAQGDAGVATTPVALRSLLAVLTVVSAVAVVYTIIKAGHTGSHSVWIDVVKPGG